MVLYLDGVRICDLVPRTEDCEYNMCLNSNNILKNKMIDLIMISKEYNVQKVIAATKNTQSVPEPHR